MGSAEGTLFNIRCVALLYFQYIIPHFYIVS